MANRFVAKVAALADIRNLPNAAGIGFYGGRFYGNSNGNVAPLTGPWFGNVINVDADNGSATDTRLPYSTIQAAVTAASAGDTIVVKPRAISATLTDPVDYAETIIIPAGKSGLRLVGDANSVTQGGQPQIKKGSGSTALLTIRSAGCLIAGLTFNGGGATGGGILLDDDALTKNAFGTEISDCYFKNCKGSSATNAATGGAIQWITAGPWQVRIVGNRFYKNVGDIVVGAGLASVPQDIVVMGNIFSGPAASVDCNIIVGSGGVSGLIIDGNVFTAFPALGGTNDTFIKLATGTAGILSNNTFASNGKTFGAGANVDIPTTVLMAHNYQEKSTSGSGEIFRT